jgi:hypothetical protein
MRFSLVAVLVALCAPASMVAAQTADLIPIPGSATVPPGGTVAFGERITDPLAQIRYPQGVGVINDSPVAATVEATTEMLTVTVSPGFLIAATVQRQPRRPTPEVLTEPCPLGESPNVARCPLGRYSNLVRFTANAMPPVREAIRLLQGCNMIMPAWLAGRPLAAVATAIAPVGALEAIWWRDLSTGRFRAWSAHPDAPNDAATIDRLDRVFICMRAPGTLVPQTT